MLKQLLTILVVFFQFNSFAIDNSSSGRADCIYDLTIEKDIMNSFLKEVDKLRGVQKNNTLIKFVVNNSNKLSPENVVELASHTQITIDKKNTVRKLNPKEYKKAFVPHEFGGVFFPEEYITFTDRVLNYAINADHNVLLEVYVYQEAANLEVEDVIYLIRHLKRTIFYNSSDLKKSADTIVGDYYNVWWKTLSSEEILQLSNEVYDKDLRALLLRNI